MLALLPSSFAADTKIIYDNNFVAHLSFTGRIEQDLFFSKNNCFLTC